MDSTTLSRSPGPAPATPDTARALPPGLTPTARWDDLGPAFSTPVPVAPVAGARLAAFSPACALATGWPAAAPAAHDSAWLPVFAGAQGVAGFASPRATVYSGHQFGQYVPRLGDGRAHTIAEFDGPRGHWEMQLKGAGADALLPLRRRPRRAALDAARVPVFRSHGRAGHPDHARAGGGGGPGHPGPPRNHRACRRAGPAGAHAHPLRAFRVLLLLRAARRF